MDCKGERQCADVCSYLVTPGTCLLFAAPRSAAQAAHSSHLACAHSTHSACSQNPAQGPAVLEGGTCSHAWTRPHLCCGGRVCRRALPGLVLRWRSADNCAPRPARGVHGQCISTCLLAKVHCLPTCKLSAHTEWGRYLDVPARLQLRCRSSRLRAAAHPACTPQAA